MQSDSPLAAINSLVNVLKLKRALIIEYVNPGLSRDQIRETVNANHPGLLPLVDDTIEAWWSWQDGIDMSKHRPRSPESYYTIDHVSPETLMVRPLGELLRTYVQHLAGYEPPRDTFPLNYDTGGSLISLCRTRHDEAWSIWYITKDGDDWRPIPTQPASPTPTFVQYIDAITDGLTTGRLQTRHGGVDPKNPADLTPPYPWT